MILKRLWISIIPYIIITLKNVTKIYHRFYLPKIIKKKKEKTATSEEALTRSREERWGMKHKNSLIYEVF